MRTSRIIKSMSSTSSHWMPNSYGFYRKAEDVEVQFYGMVNDINTEKSIFVSLKLKKKKEKEKKLKKISLHPESIAVHLNGRGGSTIGLCQHQVQNAKKINIFISINFKTSDNSACSSLYESFLLVNFLLV